MTKELSEAARAMGRKGGKARARNLTKEQIAAISRKAGLASAEKRKQEKEQQQEKDNTTQNETDS